MIYVLGKISVGQHACHCMSGGLSIQRIFILVRAGDAAWMRNYCAHNYVTETARISQIESYFLLQLCSDDANYWTALNELMNELINEWMN